mgnify:CR=1 FL=1
MLKKNSKPEVDWRSVNRKCTETLEWDDILAKIRRRSHTFPPIPDSVTTLKTLLTMKIGIKIYDGQPEVDCISGMWWYIKLSTKFQRLHPHFRHFPTEWQRFWCCLTFSDFRNSKLTTINRKCIVSLERNRYERNSNGYNHTFVCPKISCWMLETCPLEFRRLSIQFRRRNLLPVWFNVRTVEIR